MLADESDGRQRLAAREVAQVATLSARAHLSTPDAIVVLFALMRVEIYSDVVCPWCYIGKRRFEAALARVERRNEVEVVWRPYQLDPTAPALPSPVIDAYARKFGGPEQAIRIVEHLTEVAAEEGLAFRFDIAQRANTFDAHRLLWLAEHEGGAALQNAVKEQLLQAYFMEGRNIADHATLVQLASQAGMDEAQVDGFLASDKGVGEVRQEIAEGIAHGVSAVPTFVVNGGFGIPGAQDPDVFVRVLERMFEREDAARADAAAQLTGQACVDDACEVASPGS